MRLFDLFAAANDGHDTRALQAYLGHKNIQMGAGSALFDPTCRLAVLNSISSQRRSTTSDALRPCR